MPIAKIQLPNGKIGRFEVPDGTSPEQVMQYAHENLNNFKDDTPATGDSLIDLHKNSYSDVPLNKFLDDRDPERTLRTKIQNPENWNYYKNAVSQPQQGESQDATDNRLYGNKDLSQRPAQELSDIGATARNVGQGLTFNMGDELGAVGASLIEKYYGGKRTYQDFKNNINNDLQGYNEKNPLKALGANLTGGIAQGVALAPLALGNAIITGTGKLAMAGRAGLNLIDDAIQGGLSAYGDDADIGKGAVNSALVGSALRGGTKTLGAVGGAIKNKFASNVGKMNNQYVDAIAPDLIDNTPDAINRYRKVSSNIFDEISQQPKLMSDEFLNDAKTRINELRGGGFNAVNLNDATDGAFKGKVAGITEDSLVGQNVKGVNALREQEANTVLDNLKSSYGNGKDVSQVGNSIADNLDVKRDLGQKSVNKMVGDIYQDAYYNPKDLSLETKVIGQQQVGTRFNEINPNDYADNIQQTVKRPEFQQKVKYPVISFLEGKVKRGGRFARQLEAMDITPKSHPRLFGKNGQDSLDNLDASEFPEFTQAGYKPDASGSMSESDILDAISNEMTGNPIKINPENMRQSEINRYLKTEAKQREYDSYSQYARDGVKIDQFGNEMPKSTAYVAEDIYEPITKTSINPQKAFKTSNSPEITENPTIRNLLKNHIQEKMNLRVASRPEHIKPSDRGLRASDYGIEPFNSMQNIQEARQTLSKKIANAYSTGNLSDVAEWQKQRDILDYAFKESPDGAKADELYKQFKDNQTIQNQDKFGKFIDQVDKTTAQNIPRELFSGNTTPRQFKNILDELRREVDGSGAIQGDEILGSLLDDTLNKLDDKTNIDSVYNALFNQKGKREKVAMMLGGEDSDKFKHFETTMSALKNLKDTKFMGRGSTTANKQEIGNNIKDVTDFVDFSSSLKKDSLTGSVNYLVKKLASFLPDNKLPNDRRGQEVLYNFFVNPKNTETSLNFIADLKKAKSKDEAFDLFVKKYSNIPFPINRGIVQSIGNKNRTDDRKEDQELEKIKRQNFIRARGL